MFVSFPAYVNQVEKNIAIGVVSSRVVCVLYCVKVVGNTNIMREFNIHGSVLRNNILIQKSQQDALVTEFILCDDCSSYFGYHYHPSSGAQNNCNYSIW